MYFSSFFKELIISNISRATISIRIFIAGILIFATIGAYSSGYGLSGTTTDIPGLWQELKLNKILSIDVFNEAINGYHQTDNLRKKNIITIIDFSKPSTEERFFVIDMDKRKLLFHCLVAHGKNSGDDIPDSFSNEPGSLKSSLGFFLTAETYSGKHGFALRLNGLEKNINDNARIREIVIHGADYVSPDFIKKYGRLGRSWGCPALPLEITGEIIRKISNGSCLFIYGNDNSYKKNSLFLKNYQY